MESNQSPLDKTIPSNSPLIAGVPLEWDQLLTSLRETRYDTHGWNRLVYLAEQSGSIAKVRTAYESLLAVYPDNPEAQAAYVNYILKAGEYRDAEKLFERFLPTTVSVELWSAHILNLQRMNNNPTVRESVGQAFELAINCIGHDKDAGKIWMGYLQFLWQDEHETTSVGGRSRRDLLSDLFARALRIPLEDLELIWQEYMRFEGTSTSAYVRLASFASYTTPPAYLHARTVLPQLQVHIRAIRPRMKSRQALWLPHQPSFDQADRVLAGSWKSYLRWEESDPLNLEATERPLLLARVRSAYQTAFVRMRFFPEIWYMGSLWAKRLGEQEQELLVLTDGLAANATSFVLHFAYAEVLETRGLDGFQAVHDLYTTFLGSLRAHTMSCKEAGGRRPGEGDSGKDALRNLKPFDAEGADQRALTEKDFAERQREYGVVWIMYMRSARRAEGLPSFRDVFARAMSDEFTPWQVYEAAAQFEYHSTRDEASSSKIYQKGLEKFGNEVEYILRCLDFMLLIHDEKNAGVLVSTAARSVGVEQARPIWERWATHHYQHSGLATSLAIQGRMAEMYPQDNTLKRFALRYTSDGVDAIAARDLGSAYALQQAQSPVQKPSTSISRDRQTSVKQNSIRSISESYSPRHITSPRRDAYDPQGGRPELRPKRPLGPSQSERDLPPRRRRRYDAPRHHPENQPVNIPKAVRWFIETLPNAASFEGPVFPVDDVMRLLRGAAITGAPGSA
ncbi:hypothetical protein PENSPDRAFT_593406 [Peniophora sp. CONT]|nr:hypothetical protein PENSPDRAFT_593406 [Peniophora sp. CONT]